jgi:hypothetical protein
MTMRYRLDALGGTACVMSNSLRDAIALAEALARDMQVMVEVVNETEDGPAVVVGWEE